MFDVVIIGGSSAGLSAALILGRSLRHVLVIDDQKPCNRFSQASHGFLTRDGTAPSELIQIASEQLAPYSTVTRKTATVLSVEKTDFGFEMMSSDGVKQQARMLLLATGLADELPQIAGIDSLWGKSVFHCPYCDGYEVRGKTLAVYGMDEAVLHQILLLRNLTDKLSLIVAEGWQLSSAQAEKLSRLGIQVFKQTVSHLESVGTAIQGLRFADSSFLACDALFIRPKTTHRSSFAYDLGCKLTAQQLVEVDIRGRTSIMGLYAAGDIASPMRSVAIAVAQGAAAAYGMNAELVERDFA